MLKLLALSIAALASAIAWAPVYAQHAGAFKGSLDDPAIQYGTAPLDNVVVDVNRKLRDGTLKFSYDRRNGFLTAALDAFQLSTDSQLLVFSRGSLQGKRIDDQNPRALYFNDRVAVGWVRDGDVIEVAAHDTLKGVVFYKLRQTAEPPPSPPQFTRAFECLGCHVTGDTLGVPGLLMFSTTRRVGQAFDGVPRHIDQSDPLAQRFGGWFVTGSTGSATHMGNDVPALDGRPSHELTSVDHLFDPDGYRALTSDVAAHLVLTHQAAMTNLLTRAGWEARIASGPEDAVSAVVNGVAQEVVDHLLFLDETPLRDRVRGNSGFAERFSARGPRDRQGRSLYELDLTRRLMKYPCSYMIYSPAFDALPRLAKDAIYRRMWDVLSAHEESSRYRSALPLRVRQSIVEILRDTKKDLPEYFRAVR